MKTPLSTTRPALWTLSAAVLLTAIALLTYANTFNAPFVFDDLPNIVQNPLIRMSRLTPENMAGILKNQFGNRPLAYASFAFNYHLDRYNVRGYHAVNLIIHVITALLVFLVTRQTLRLCSSTYRLLPFFVAALWLVHPVHTQSVTYIVQRMNSMAAMFYLLALFCYIRARANAKTGGHLLKRLLLYTLCLTTALLGLASKQIVATLPIFFLLYEWFFFQNLDRGWLKKQLRWLGLATVICVTLAVFYLDGSPFKTIAATYAEQPFTPVQRLLTEPRVVVYYLSLLFWPHPARLNVDYDFPLSASPLNPAVTALSLLALAALLAVACYRPARHRLLSFAILWFLGNLAIESSVIGMAIIFEHRIYLPSPFLFTVFTVLMIRHLPRPVSFIGLCLIVIISGVWTYQRNTVWGDTLVFWQDCAAKSPRQARPANGVGMAWQTRHQHEKALEWFQKAARLNPSYDEAHSNIGGILVNLGRPAEALPHLQRAVSFNPESYEAFSNLGSAMHRLNRLDDAITYFQKSISIYPDYEIAHNNLGAVLTEKGDIDGGIRHLNWALRINPGYHEPYNNLGLAMTRLGRTQAAIDYYKQALRLNPESDTAHFNLGTACFQKQDMDCARHHLQQAARLNPDAVLTLNNLAAVLVMQKKFEEALDALNRLAGLRPESSTVYYNLACVYALWGKKEEAVAVLEKAVGLGYDRWTHMKTDPDLKNIYDTDYFKSLMRLNDM